jgi:hypothetical protein
VYISYIFGLLSSKAAGSFPPGFFNGTGFSNTVSSGDHSGSGLIQTETVHDANLATKVITAKVSTYVDFFSV